MPIAGSGFARYHDCRAIETSPTSPTGEGWNGSSRNIQSEECLSDHQMGHAGLGMPTLTCTYLRTDMQMRCRSPGSSRSVSADKRSANGRGPACLSRLCLSSRSQKAPGGLKLNHILARRHHVVRLISIWNVRAARAVVAEISPHASLVAVLLHASFAKGCFDH